MGGEQAERCGVQAAPERAGAGGDEEGALQGEAATARGHGEAE